MILITFSWMNNILYPSQKGALKDKFDLLKYLIISVKVKISHLELPGRYLQVSQYTIQIMKYLEMPDGEL